MNKLHPVKAHMRRSPATDPRTAAMTDRLRAEVANFDHVEGILVADLSEKLSGMSQADIERIREGW